MYDLTTIVDRKNTGSLKWDHTPENIKKAGLAPLSIADMEFKVAPQITRAIIKAAEHGVYGYTGADDEYYNAVMAVRGDNPTVDDPMIEESEET